MLRSSVPIVGGPQLGFRQTGNLSNTIGKILHDEGWVNFITEPETYPYVEGQKPIIVLQGFFPSTPNNTRIIKLQEAVRKIECLGYKVDIYRLPCTSRGDALIAGSIGGQYDPEREIFQDKYLFYLYPKTA